MPESRLRPSAVLTRRGFTRALAWSALGTTALAPIARAADPASGLPAPSPPAPRVLLDESPFVYISPLKRDGSESTCHGELWYAWLDDAVVVTVAAIVAMAATIVAMAIVAAAAAIEPQQPSPLPS